MTQQCARVTTGIGTDQLWRRSGSGGAATLTGRGPGLKVLRTLEYGDRSYVAALAREGFVVMAHDCFLWGSRRFPRETMIVAVGDHAPELSPFTDAPPDIEHYNTLAALHEHHVSKYCNVLGTSLAGVVRYEDRIAVNYLLSRSDVLADRVGCIGLSGGGNRVGQFYPGPHKFDRDMQAPLPG